MKSNRRKKALAQKRQARKTRFAEGGKGNSRYARKAAYLHKNGLWGWEVPHPKPW